MLYKRAVVLALAARGNEALAALTAAVKHDFSRTVIKADDDLMSLRQLPGYTALTELSR